MKWKRNCYDLVRINAVLSHKEKKRCLDASANLFYRLEDWFYEECRIKKSKEAITAEIFTSWWNEKDSI